MSSTISNSIGHGITLTSSAYTNPVTVTSTIDAATGDALMANSPWTIVTSGSIFASTGEGIFLKAGGFIDNSGTIFSAIAYGVSASIEPTSLTNTGYIFGLKGGVAFNEGNLELENMLDGTIIGGTLAPDGVKFSGNGSTSTLANYGLIGNNNAAGTGLYLNLATATNYEGGVISGGAVGVRINDYSTFINMGTVTGAIGIAVGENQDHVAIIDGGTISPSHPGGSAISFASGLTGDSLTLLPGAELDGLANGAGDATLDFAGTLLGTMSSLSHELTLFPTVNVETAAKWDFSGASTMSGQSILTNNGTIVESTGDNLTILSSIGGTGSFDLAGGTLSFNGNVGSGQTINFQSASSVMILGQPHSIIGQIDGFEQGNTIELTGYGSGETVTSRQIGNLFDVIANGTTMALTLSAGTPQLQLQTLSTVGGSKSYEIVAQCFRAGTRILTPDGPRPVETLRTGDLVVAHSGGFRPIIWHGHRHIDCRRYPKPALVMPVLITEGAFGPGVPSRDLYVSPDHSIYADHVLVPAKCLIDGVSIRQVDVPEVTYHHIELETHDAVWAETLPAETYLDCGNRHNFAGQDAPIALHADFAPPGWDYTRAFAPLVFEGPLLTAIRQRLHDRLRERGIRPVAGRYAVYTDGRLLETAHPASGPRILRLPRASHRLLFDSSSSCPGDFDPASLDRRRLGIAITNLMADGALVKPDDPRFGAGFHPAEQRGRRWHRWTDGAASFDVSGVREIAFTVQAVSPVWHVPEEWRSPAMRRRVLELHSP